MKLRTLTLCFVHVTIHNLVYGLPGTDVNNETSSQLFFAKRLIDLYGANGSISAEQIDSLLAKIGHPRESNHEKRDTSSENHGGVANHVEAHEAEEKDTGLVTQVPETLLGTDRCLEKQWIQDEACLGTKVSGSL